MRTRILATTALLSLTTLAGLLNADIGPKPSKIGPGLAPTSYMPGINVEMTSEKVDLVLTRSKGDDEQLSVTADFNMTNLGDGATSFEIGFPIGPIHNMDGFSIEIDGRRIAHRLIDRSGGKIRELTEAQARPKQGADWPLVGRDLWYVWQASFPKGRSRHLVKYRITIGHWSEYRWSGYILHTGAPWKNKIGKAVVTLRCAGGLTLDNISSVKPMEGLSRGKDTLTWTFSQLEPTKQHDISVNYNRRATWQTQSAELRSEIAEHWSARTDLAYLLTEVPDRFGKRTWTEQQLTEALAALESVISEATVQDGKLVLPRKEPTRTRFSKDLSPAHIAWLRKTRGRSTRTYAYRNGFDQLTPFFRRSVNLAVSHPENAEARRVLAGYVRLVEAHLAGKLYAGSTRITLVGKGAAGRRATLRQLLAKARQFVKP